MITSEDGLVIEFEKGEEIVLDREYEWINATDYANRSLGRSIMIRGLKASKSDIEKFIDLYKSVGIELEPVVNERNKDHGYQYIEDGLLNFNANIPNYDHYVRLRLYFDESCKFIQQGIWE